jgi:hypothetical protein
MQIDYAVQIWNGRKSPGANENRRTGMLPNDVAPVIYSRTNRNR